MSGNLPREYGDLRFLVVDDKPFIRNIVNGMLSRSGARHIANAENGEDAVDRLQKAGGRCDCLISDWNMEPINGLRLLQMVRARQISHATPDLCFILLTGTAQADVVNTAINLDVNAYLVKPVSHMKLINAVKSAMERTWSLKGAKHYLAVQGIETPPALKDGAKKASPWLTLSSMSPILTPRKDHPTAIQTDPDHRELQAANRSEEMIIKNKRRRLIGKIKIGSVLAEDVYDADGKLVLAMGTTLDKKLLSRLHEAILEQDANAGLLIGDLHVSRK